MIIHLHMQNLHVYVEMIVTISHLQKLELSCLWNPRGIYLHNGVFHHAKVCLQDHVNGESVVEPLFIQINH